MQSKVFSETRKCVLIITYYAENVELHMRRFDLSKFTPLTMRFRDECDSLVVRMAISTCTKL